VAKPKKGFKKPDRSVSQKDFFKYFTTQEPKKIARRLLSRSKLLDKPVRPVKGSKRRRATTKIILSEKEVNIGKNDFPMKKSILRISLLNRKIKIDNSIFSRVILKKAIQEFVNKPSTKKKFKVKKNSKGLIRIVFKEKHRKALKLRKKDDIEYNSKKHEIAVSTVITDIDSLGDFVRTADFLMDFLQEDIERYIKYTDQVNKSSLLLNFIELVIYEVDAKKNKNRPKIKKRTKKIRSSRR